MRHVHQVVADGHTIVALHEVLDEAARHGVPLSAMVSVDRQIEGNGYRLVQPEEGKMVATFTWEAPYEPAPQS